MANSLGIDFNPQPAYGSDPFAPIAEGANLGFGLVQNVQQIKKQQQDMKTEQEKVQLLKFGQLVDLYDKTKTPKLKEIYYRDTLRPAAKQALGADLPEQPTNDFDEHLSAAAELSRQLTKGEIKFPDYKARLGAIYFDAVKKGNTEAATAISTGAKFGEEPNQVPTGQTPEFQQLQLRIEFAARVKDINYLNRKEAYQEANNAIRNPSVVNDIGLIYAVAKMRDPGGRLANQDVEQAAKAGALPQELQAYWNSVFNKNKRLSDFARKSLADSVSQLYSNYKQNYDILKNNYRDKALEAGLNPSNVTDIFDEKMVTFTDSDGIDHTIPAANLDAAKKRDPGLKVKQ